jgi:hypothetical protein
MKINLSKFFSGNTEVIYIGFRPTPMGIKPGKEKIKPVKTAKFLRQRRKFNLLWDYATTSELTSRI